MPAMGNNYVPLDTFQKASRTSLKASTDLNISPLEPVFDACHAVLNIWAKKLLVTHYLLIALRISATATRTAPSIA